MKDLTNFDFKRILNDENSEIKRVISATLDKHGEAAIVITAGPNECQVKLDQQELLEVAFSLLCLVQTPVDTDVAYDLAETNLDDEDAIKDTAKILKELRKNLLDT